MFMFIVYDFNVYYFKIDNSLFGIILNIVV